MEQNMQAAAGKDRKKTRIIRWRGMLDANTRTLRWMVAIVLAVAGGAVAFTQLGFVRITLPSGVSGYVIILLQIVALGSLLLGTLPGAALGIVVGGVLLLHSQIMPLDHYELTYVTPVTSIVMLGVSGLLLGILFAFALRNNPGQVKRIIYIAIICIFVSWLYSLGFAFNVISSLAGEIMSRLGSDVSGSYVQRTASKTAMQFGSVRMQAWTTAIIMALICFVGDYAARKVTQRNESFGLRTVFGSWLAVVAALTFMAMSALGFAITTADELHDAETLMKGEVGYLRNQFEDSDERTDLFVKLLSDAHYLDDDSNESIVSDVQETITGERLLNGYDIADDGIVVVTSDTQASDEVVYASDDPRFPKDALTRDVFSEDMVDAIKGSVESGRMQRFVFDDNDSPSKQQDKLSASESIPEIVYLYAERLYPNRDEDVNSQDSQTVIMMKTSHQVFTERGEVMGWMGLSVLVLLIAVFSIVFQLLNNVVARRIDEENTTLSLITAGDLSTRAEAGGTREFESLSEGINTTVDALQSWIAEAETRMDAELATAKAIQEATLPRIFPPFPDILKFDIYASMKTAKEVGGDFYDFFLIGDNCGAESGKLGFVIADVSEKGIPAALFMMKAKALLRDYMTSGLEIGEAVDEANRLLADGNDADMFVTVWAGVLDYGTGHVDYVNAGHNPPLLWQRDGGWRWLEKRSGPMLGLYEVPYKAHSVDCTAGDMFVLYTDGVTEAFDEDEELYGAERLLAVAEAGYRLHPREILKSIRDDVAAHTKNAEQSDDITILALEVGVPPEITATLEVPAEISQLDAINEFLHAELDRRLCPKSAQNQLDIAVEELFVNVCNYAYPDATPENPGRVRIHRTYRAEPQSITVDIIDDGIPYDPLAKPDAVIPKNILDVPIGGLGILMAKKCSDEMLYERVDDSNVVTIVKRW